MSALGPVLDMALRVVAAFFVVMLVFGILALAVGLLTAEEGE